MGEPQISIVVPVYNSGEYLKQCIESIICQSFGDYEVVLVDDGSIDNSPIICDNYSMRYKFIKTIHQANMGVSAARNAGIENTSGKYLLFVDSDDTLPTDSIERLLRSIKDHDAQAAFGNHNYHYDSKLLKRPNRIKPGLHYKPELLNILIDDGTLSGITFGSVCGAIYQSNVIRENKIRFQENLMINEDGVFNIEYCLCTSAIWYESEAVYNYRQWKKASQQNAEVIKIRLNKTNQVIEQLAANYFPVNEVTQKQLQARILFCIFQLSLIIAEGANKNPIRNLRYLWRETLIDQSKIVLNFEGMNRYKRMLWSLISKRKPMMFWVTIHYAYPFLKTIVKR